jgi:FMN phosphatase YigB (HAD superfamily)
LIKLIAFDLVGVLAYENDYELNELEDKIERLFGPNPNDEDFINKALSYVNSREEISSMTSEIINNIYSVRDANIISKIKEIRPDIKIVIATNHVSAIHDWIEKMPFYGLLDGAFISADIGCCKPDASFYQKVSEGMKVDKKDILFIDDSPKNIEGAKEYGMSTLLYNRADDLFECVKKAI